MAAETFNGQTATRLTEYDLLDLGMEEIENGGAPWQYFWNNAQDDEEEERNQENRHETVTGGTKVFVYGDEDGDPCFELGGRSKQNAVELADTGVFRLFAGQTPGPQRHGIAGC